MAKKKAGTLGDTIIIVLVLVAIVAIGVLVFKH